MKIELKVPGFRMPKKKYKVYFKQPNKLKLNLEDLACCQKQEYLHLPLIISIISKYAHRPFN